MGCLFRCFLRAKAEEQSTVGDSVSQPPGVNSIRGHDSKNRLSALFLSQDSPPRHHREGSGLHIHNDLIIKDEVQLLKACGVTTATPIEIRKASQKLETPQRGKQLTSSQVHSWISDAVFHLDEPCEEFSEQTPSSCVTRISTGYSDAGEESQEGIGTEFRDGVYRPSKVPFTDGKRKSVWSKCDFDQSYSSTSSKNSTSKTPEKAGKSNFSTTSRNLTSLKLSDEIQTPAVMESAVRGRPRIRSHCLHSASSLTENASICKLPEDSDETKEHACKEKKEPESPIPVTCEGKLEESSASPSPWVKQSEEKSNQKVTATISTVTYGDRPIIGTAAAHWNEKEQSQISPKWWDGNGIPNSTNKYKEDQKVSWHVTSFEERLEKALSEEGGQGFIPSRKLELMEEAERDTAISQLHHPAQSTSIVSF
ncbi:PREDICTED: protein JASON-like isoform X2 [Brassica oleracea var. oleracea]|uniref:protein JASON-like isoform X2 n=1 Tax=Brassica oleracea var. oleracea TaxID=109376 RepID=UPI0006A72848|nr:PREDICTED: protein JASON-like isoform X2 [Brassica oleracea var. oleracea]